MKFLCWGLLLQRRWGSSSCHLGVGGETDIPARETKPWDFINRFTGQVLKSVAFILWCTREYLPITNREQSSFLLITFDDFIRACFRNFMHLIYSCPSPVDRMQAIPVLDTHPSSLPNEDSSNGPSPRNLTQEPEKPHLPLSDWTEPGSLALDILTQMESSGKDASSVSLIRVLLANVSFLITRQW